MESYRNSMAGEDRRMTASGELGPRPAMAGSTVLPSGVTDLVRQLQSPEATWRIQPFWFWNGDLEETEIVRQIEEMAEQGVGGFFVCARQGMHVPYLSDAWFAKVRVAAEAARERGLDVWLYDEYPYPSGIAGGEVTLEHPDAKQRMLVHRVIPAAGGVTCTQELPWGRILSARAVPRRASGVPAWERAVDVRRYIGNDQVQPVFQKTGLTSYNQKRFFTYQTVQKLQWTPPPGDWEVHVFLEEEIDDFKYYGTFVDPCHKEAMATFIRLTHQRYADELGEYFGHPIKGIFTDEIAPLGKLPWSPRLPEAFWTRNGYRIEDHLQALTRTDGEPLRMDAGAEPGESGQAAPETDGEPLPGSRVRYDYFRTLHELLQESYHQPVSAWCEAHGLAYVTEVPAMRMATQAHSHVPGGDSAHEKIGRPLEWILDKYTADLRANPKMVSSVAAQYGRERALIECFHSVGWSMTLQDARWMIDRMAALGINFYNFHAFFYTLDGMTQHDAPPSQFDQNPYWQHFRQLGDYTGRISKLMGTGRAIRRIAILDPVTTLWTMLANPLHKYDYSGTDEAGEARLAAYKRYWIELCKTLIQTRRDYDHLDPLILAEQGGVEDGKLLVGQAAYELVLLPPLANLESRAWDVLSRFIAAGGQVIALGMLPHEPIEGDDRVAQELRAAFGLTPDEGTAAAFWDMGRQKDPDRDDAEPKQASGQQGDVAAAGAEESGLSRQQYGAVAAGSGLGSGGSSASAAQPGLHFVPSGAELSEEVRQTLLQLLDERLPEPVRLQSTARSLLVQQRELAEDVRAVFASHQEDGEVRAELVMDGTVAGATGTLVAYALSLENGELTELQLEQRAGGSGAFSLQLTFAPYQSHLILIAPGEAGADIRGWAGGPRAELVLPASGTWDFMAKRDNAIRFDSFAITLSAPGRDALPGGAFRADAKTIIDQLGDAVAAGVTLPLAFEQPFGTPVRTAVAYPLRAVYEAVFEADQLPERCELLMDRGAIGGAWRILLNGHALTAADFAPVRFYDNSNQSCDVSGLLVQGENRLSIEVDVSSDWEGVTDALYLTGPFGVAFADPHRPVMTALPERAELQAGPYPGLPYYAGELVFRRTFDLTEEELPQSERFRLTFADLDPAFHDCAGVALNGHALGVRTWTPYVWEGGSGVLQEGANTVEVTVTNTLVGLLEGRYFDKAAHALHPVYEHPLFRPQLGAVQGSGEQSG